VGGAVDQQQQRDGDAEEQPGQGAEDQHAEQGGDRGDEVGAGGHAVVATEPAGVDAVQGGQGRNVDQLDDRGDHHRRQGRLGQALEQSGQGQQGDDGQGGHDQPRQLGPGAGGAVDRGLGQAPADDHAAGQAGAQVGRPHAEQLAAGVDLVVLAGRVGLGRAEALGEADHQDPDRGRGELEVVDGGHVGQSEGGQARLDVADDGRAVPVQAEQLDDDDPEHDRDQRPGNHWGDPPEPQDQCQRYQPEQQC
jgi:hypothetical protein